LATAQKVTLGNRSGGLLIHFIFYIIYSMPQYESGRRRRMRREEGFNASVVNKVHFARDLGRRRRGLSIPNRRRRRRGRSSWTRTINTEEFCTVRICLSDSIVR
jgi:hypothetical protein